MWLIIGLVIGVILGVLIYCRPRYHGPNSNEVRKKIHVDENGKPYRLVPQVYLSYKS